MNAPRDRRDRYGDGIESEFQTRAVNSKQRTMKFSSRPWRFSNWNRQRQVSTRTPSSGFTLIEVLVATIASTFVVAGILGLLQGVAEDERRERVRTETDRDMRQALDYIANDLRSAVYIYTGQELDDRVTAALGLESSTQYEPILVFWKPELIPYTTFGAEIPIDCTGTSIQSNPDECQELQIEQQTYSLVAYIQDTDTSNDIAVGQSSIRRYILRKYDTEETFTESGEEVLALAENSGYVDPTGDNIFFSVWPENNTGLNQQNGTPTVDGTTAPILVDFVAAPSTAASTGDCPAGYTRTPNDTSDSGTDADAQSFYACVRNVTELGASNQDIFVYLQGSADGRDGYDESSDLPLTKLQTQVILRGVIDKEVN